MRVLLIDGLNMVRRIHAGVPGEAGSETHAGDVLSAVRRSLGRALDQAGASHAAVVFDAPPPTWRHALHDGYKAGRKPMPADLQALMPGIEEAFRERGVLPLQVAGFEADDVLASMAVRVAGHGGQVVILSTDKALLGLLAGGVAVRNHFDGSDLDAEHVRRRYGIEPRQLADYVALTGDSGQGIPGVPGIGARTAASLLAEHGDLDRLLAHAADLSGRAGKALRAGREAALLSRRLAALRTDVEVGVNLKDCRLPARHE